MTTAPAFTPRAAAEFTLLALLWGGSFFLVEIGLREVGPMTLVAHRCVWGALALWVYVAWRGIEIPRAPRIWAALFVMGMLNNAIPFGLIVWGQTAIEGGLASIFNAMTAVFGVVVAGIVFRDERLTARKLVGALVGFLGVLIAMGTDALGALDPRSLGQLAVLGATISYAFAAAWGRATLAGVAREVSAAGMLTASGVTMLIIATLTEGLPSFALSGGVWIAVLGLAAGATSLAYLLYFSILKQAGAGNLMLVTLAIPPVAILLGAAFLGESLSANALIGFLVIALGFAIIDGRLVAAASRHRWRA